MAGYRAPVAVKARPAFLLQVNVAPSLFVSVMNSVQLELIAAGKLPKDNRRRSVYREECTKLAAPSRNTLESEVEEWVSG
jgi:hypothetical protein